MCAAAALQLLAQHRQMRAACFSSIVLLLDLQARPKTCYKGLPDNKGQDSASQAPNSSNVHASASAAIAWMNGTLNR
jgi:hypothetical protein